jgi:hypothetical protein
MPRVALRSRSHELCEGAVAKTYAVIEISNQMLEDSAFDTEGEIRGRRSDRVTLGVSRPSLWDPEGLRRW